ncbi:MAG TPA: TMEM165/GDT1 family protein [Burkholderiaceae bacterium]
MEALEAFAVSATAVAVGEIGDKTQLVALMLAARFRRPVPIIAGILVATLANHTLAALVGTWIRQSVDAQYLRWGLGASFLAAGLWALKPDRLEHTETAPVAHAGVFLVTLGTFFLAEIGDRTQIATMMLAARYPSLPAVVGGTTLGMLAADIPAVLLGQTAADRIPLRLVRWVAAALFAIIGIATLAGLGSD